MAEAGNNTIQESTPFMLVDCAKVDGAMNLNQDADYQAFLDNEGQSTGRGPNLVSRADNDRIGKMSRAKQFAELLRNRNMDSELEQFNNPSQFISSRKASHKQSNKSNGVQGKHVQEKWEKKNKQNKTNRQIPLQNLKQRLEKACFFAQGGSIEDLPNVTCANEDSGSAISTSNQNQQPAEPPTSNVPDNASNVPTAASSSNAAMSQVPPLQIRPSDYTPLKPPMVTKCGSLAIGRCKGCWEKIDFSNVGPGIDMAMRLRYGRIPGLVTIAKVHAMHNSI